jgi:hypothetical protein
VSQCHCHGASRPSGSVVLTNSVLFKLQEPVLLAAAGCMLLSIRYLYLSLFSTPTYPPRCTLPPPPVFATRLRSPFVRLVSLGPRRPSTPTVASSPVATCTSAPSYRASQLQCTYACSLHLPPVAPTLAHTLPVLPSPPTPQAQFLLWCLQCAVH